jgi:hypothetical protein
MGSRKMEPPAKACQQVRFESGPREEKKTVSIDVHTNRMHHFKTMRIAGHTTSTPANSNQNQELSKEFRGVLSVKVTQSVLL